MDQVLHDFVRALRGSGVRISVSEVLDAIHAARLTGYKNREILKDALSVTMAKSLY